MPDTPTHAIIPKTVLSDAEIAEMRALAGDLMRDEGLEPRILWDTLAAPNGDQTRALLCYDAGRLAGFLTLDGLGDDEAEATGMVAPAHRRRGIFRALVAAAQAECRAAGTGALILICDRRSESARRFLHAIGARRSFAEHRMRLDVAGPSAILSTDLEVARATQNDAPAIAAILAADAGFPPDGFAQHITRMMRQPNYVYYIAKRGGAPVGTLNVQTLDGDAYIYGFVVVPEQRGRGYGRQILARAIADIVTARRQPVFLEVEEGNEPALRLYRSAGFTITHTFDYYRVDADK